MTSTNEAKLEDLQKEMDRRIHNAGSYAITKDLLDRAFHLGRMEQHERVIGAIEKAEFPKEYDNATRDERRWCDIGSNTVYDAVNCVSPVEGEE